MPDQRRLEIALFILRLSTGAFLVAWTSLKFFRPEWMVNIFHNVYGQAWATQDLSYVIGGIQALLVLAFLAGFARTFTYGLVTIMHATGVIGSIPGLINFTKYPNNLMWAAVAALGALVALFILRKWDNLFSISGVKNRREV
ncbi:MAG: hypothetical protein ABJN26_24185 [Stappiaceae bacterium]